MKPNQLKRIYFVWDAIFTNKHDAQRHCNNYYAGDEPGIGYVTYHNESDFSIVLEKDGIAIKEPGVRIHKTKEEAMNHLK